MTRKLLVPLILLATLTTGVALLVGCKQGEGARCQVTDDCQAGLICNQGTKPPSCQATVGGGIDATVPEADIDAVPDVMPD